MSAARHQHRIVATTSTASPRPLALNTTRRRGMLALKSFRLVGGEELGDLELAWQDWGEPSAPVAIVLGGISAGRDIGNWWGRQCGDGRALDPRHLRLLSIDWIGGADASTGPREGVDFPAIDSVDQAHALLALLNHLGISRVALVVGASYGACVAQHLVALLGSRLGQLVCIGAAHRASPWALALRTLQRAGISAAAGAQGRVDALKRARQIAVLGYRTPDELEQRFGDSDAEQGVLGWLAGHGDRFAARFCAEAFLCLSASLDAHHCEPASIAVPTSVIAFDSDLIAPPRLLQDFAARVAGPATFLTITSLYGHDAFLKEVDAVASVLGDCVAGELA